MTVSSPVPLPLDRRFARPARRFSPLLVLIGALILLPLFLIVTIPQPIGPMFWDQYLYLDAANRIHDGQIPSVDFFAPVGALGYYVFALALKLFPSGSPLLLSSWSLLFVSAPLMALVLIDVSRRSVLIAFALLIPFLFFSLLPFNLGEFYPFPGSDGFGIYNRQVCQLLYVLAAALLFIEQTRLLIAAVALGMLALFLTKVTGAVAGTALCFMALIAGRLSLRAGVAAALIVLVALGLLEIGFGLVSAYLGNILALVEVNEGSLLPRLLQAASLNFGAALAIVLLAAALFVLDRALLAQRLAILRRKRSLAALTRLLDHPSLWLLAFLVAGLLFESQNTGSQALIFVWPLLIAILADRMEGPSPSSGEAIVAVLALALVLPQVSTLVQKAGRAWIGTVGNVRLGSAHLKTMGAVNLRPFMALRAERMDRIYVDQRAAYREIAAAGEHGSFLLFSDYDFQAGWLRQVDRTVGALKAYEADHGVHFETLFNIDFTNPYPYLMDRHAPKAVAIGADPFRAVPPVDQAVTAALSAVDVAILPTCPVTTTREALRALYEPSLAGTHQRIALTPCSDAFIRNDLVKAR